MHTILEPPTCQSFNFQRTVKHVIQFQYTRKKLYLPKTLNENLQDDEKAFGFLTAFKLYNRI